MTTSNVKQHTISIRTFEPTSSGASMRILLLKLDHIGDYITALPAFRLMRRAFPAAEITLMCLPVVAPMAEACGLFNRVIGFNAEPESAEVGKASLPDKSILFSDFARLAGGPYALAVDFKHDAFAPTWLDYVEADCRAGFARETVRGLDIVLPVMEWHMPVAERDKKNPPVHAEVRLTLLAHAVIESLATASPCSDYIVPAMGTMKEPSYKALKSCKRPVVGMGVGAGAEVRQWPLNYWTQLAQKLVQQDNMCVAFFGGPNDALETQIVTSSLPADRVFDFTGSVPLAHVSAYLRLLQGYIGCDTGLTHMAAALGLPVVDIYAGVSNPHIWRARGAKVKTVYAEVLCAPCHLRFKKDCPNGNVCMNVLGMDIIYTCFQQVMTKK